MARYYLKFSKKGYIKYISHLDLQRLFKRTFKRLNIPIEYSKGFNPHPRMGFAQPLSLGYSGEHEYLEFNTSTSIDIKNTYENLAENMPEGIDIIKLDELNIKPKSLASIVIKSVYTVILPIQYRSRHKDIEKYVHGYLAQKEINAEKKEKKTKKIVLKNIKDQIESINVIDSDGLIGLLMTVDSGSNSNLSPEQVISSFRDYSKLYLPREEIEVIRNTIIFDNY